jgi:membrane protein
MFSPLLSLRALAARIFHRFVEENFDQISASLAFTTLLSLVPLVAVVLGIMSLAPSFFGTMEHFDQFIVRVLLPERSAGMIIDYVLQFSQKAANVTVIGFLVLVVTVYLLLMTIERAFNHVWCVVENRAWWRRLRLYAAVLALWPLVVTCVILAISYEVTGLSVATVFFAGLYYAVPNTRVEPRHALWAGLFAAFGFLLMQKVFEFYLSNFPSFALIYGAFATVPIFLLWLYLSWAIVLLGALLAATLPEFRSNNLQ